MLCWRVLCIAIFLNSSVWADEPSSGITVMSYDPAVDARDFGGQHEFKNESVKNLTAQKSQMPTRLKRERAFSESGLNEETRGMDSLDRDLLYLYAEQRSVGEISKKFPKISQNKIKVLKDWVQKNAKE